MRLILSEQLPLQQGLKPKVVPSAISSKSLSEQLPLQQGLKPWWIYFKDFKKKPFRTTSTTTRIET